MPPRGTRKTSATRSSQTQGTLAFGAQNKITKPSTSTGGSKKALSKSALATVVDAVTAEPSPDPEHFTRNDTPQSLRNNDKPPPLTPPPSTSHPLALRKQHHQIQTQTPPSITKAPVSTSPLDPLESHALSLPPSALKKYWQRKESSRLHPRIHQQNLTLHEKILREFDLSSQFGPCIGISRLRRWKRAEGLGLEPPVEVLGVLVAEREMEKEGVKGKRGEGKGEWDRAAMEGLLSSGSREKGGVEG